MKTTDAIDEREVLNQFAKYFLIGWASCVILALSIGGCATVTPPVTPSAQTPVGNGGILSGVKGGPFRLTGDEHARYNALVAIWGTKGGFLPPLVPNAGISAISPQDGSCLIDGEHMVDLVLMQAYQDGRAKP